MAYIVYHNNFTNNYLCKQLIKIALIQRLILFTKTAQLIMLLVKTRLLLKKAEINLTFSMTCYRSKLPHKVLSITVTTSRINVGHYLCCISCKKGYSINSERMVFILLSY